VYQNTGLVQATKKSDPSSEKLNSNSVVSLINLISTNRVASFLRTSPVISSLLPSSPQALGKAVAPATARETTKANVSNVPRALAYGGNTKNLLAAAFFGTPTGKQLSTVTLILAVLTVGLMAFRRRNKRSI
jgi:hypothetical protein